MVKPFKASGTQHYYLKDIKLKNYFPLLLLILIPSFGCTSKVSTNQFNQNNPANQSTTAQAGSDSSNSSGTAQIDDGIDYSQEMKVSDGCLSAWRKALNHNGDGAIKELKALGKQYPRATTVDLMMGQVLEHLGKKKEAVEYYRKAVNNSNSDAMYMYKLAESLSTTDDIKGTIAAYQNLLKLNPHFAPARLGIAKALLKQDKNSKQARQEVRQVLEEEPDNQEAKTLASQINLTKH